MNDDHMKFVDFTKCEDCVHFDELDKNWGENDTCEDCLLHPVNFESTKPLRFEAKEN